MIEDVNSRSIVVMGDIHGAFHKAYTLNVEHSCIIVAGDCGFGFKSDQQIAEMYAKAKRVLERKDNLVLFVRGNHDAPMWFDGIRFNHGRMKCISDYTVVKNDRHNVLCIGGAVSVDRSWRIENFRKRKKSPDWWQDEIPFFNPEAIERITAAGIHIDTIVSHTCPSFAFPTRKKGVEEFLDCDVNLMQDLCKERNTMDEIYACLKTHNHPFKQWVYGHFHDSHRRVYNEVEYVLLNIGENFGI